MAQRETASIVVQIRGGLKAAAEADAVADGMDKLGDQTREAGEDAGLAAVAFDRLQRQIRGLARAEALASLASSSMTLALLGVRAAAIGLAVIALPALVVAFGQVGAAALIWSTALLAGMGGIVAGAALMTLGVVGRFQQMKDVVGSAAYDLVGAVGQLKSTFLQVAATGADRVMRGIADALKLLLPVVASLAPGLDAIGSATAGMFRSLGKEIAGMGPQLRAFLSAVPGAIRSVGEFAGSALKLFLSLAVVGLPLATKALHAVAGVMRDIADWFTPKRYEGAVSTLRSFAAAVGTFFSSAAAPLKGVLGPGIREFGQTARASIGPVGTIIGTILAAFVQLGRAVLPAAATALAIIARHLGGLGPKLKTLNVHAIGDFLVRAVNAVDHALTSAIPKVIKFGRQVIDALKGAAPFITNVIWPLAKGITQGIGKAIKDTIPVIKFIANAIGWLGEKAKPLRSIIQTVGQVLGYVFAGPILVKAASWVGKLASVGGKLGSVFRAASSIMRVIGRVLSEFPQIVGVVVGAFGRLIGIVKGLPHRIANAASGMWDGFKHAANSAVHWVADRLRDLVALIKRIPGAITGAVTSLPKKALGAAGRLIPKIPGLATGGVVNTAGFVWVGERGPELLSLPAGASVFPATRAATTGSLPTSPIAIGRSPAPIRAPRNAPSSEAGLAHLVAALVATERQRTIDNHITLKVGERELARAVHRSDLDDKGRNT